MGSKPVCVLVRQINDLVLGGYHQRLNIVYVAALFLTVYVRRNAKQYPSTQKEHVSLSCIWNQNFVPERNTRFHVICPFYVIAK